MAASQTDIVGRGLTVESSSSRIHAIRITRPAVGVAGGVESEASRKIARAVELLSLVSIAVTLPIGVAEFYFGRREERRERIEDNYDQLDQRYIEFEQLCLANIALDCADEAMIPPPAMSPEDRMKQRLLYNILLSILERAYLRYQLEELDDRRSQWAGWDEYATRFLTRPSFRELWNEQGGDSDSYFQDYMNAKIRKHERELTRTAGTPR